MLILRTARCTLRHLLPDDAAMMLALNAGGTLRCWGLNTSGQIGNGSTAPVTAPQPPTPQKW